MWEQTQAGRIWRDWLEYYNIDDVRSPSLLPVVISPDAVLLFEVRTEGDGKTRSFRMGYWEKLAMNWNVRWELVHMHGRQANLKFETLAIGDTVVPGVLPNTNLVWFELPRPRRDGDEESDPSRYLNSLTLYLKVSGPLGHLVLFGPGVNESEFCSFLSEGNLKVSIQVPL